MIISMIDFGQSLVTRAGGRDAYKKIMLSLNSSSDVVVFDFTGVSSITNSFADEVFGQMICELGEQNMRQKTTFKNITPFSANVIRFAMASRQKMLATC